MTTTSSDLVIIATAKAQPGKEAELEAALREVAAPTRAQPGCVQFTVLRAGSAIVGYERWASEQAHRQHLQGAHVQRLMARMANLLAEPPSIVSHAVIDE